VVAPAGIDPIKVARRLWNAARRDPLAGSSRLAAAWSRIMTRGRSNEPAGEDISNLGSIVGPASAAAHAAALGVMGLADQTVVNNLEDVRSHRAFERSLIGS
jgi:hypothetical protein